MKSASFQNAKPRPAALLCFDFDGTLVDRFAEPSFDPRLGERLGDLSTRGLAWAINTGRSLSYTLEGLAQHGVSSEPDFIIAREHEIFRRESPGQWSDFGHWNGACRRKHETFFREHGGLLREVRAFVERRARAKWLEVEGDPAGLVATSEEAMVEIAAFVDQLRVEWPDLGYQRNSIYMRFTHCDYHKGSALAELTAQLGLSASQVFAAGDNHNDLPMLRAEIARALCCPSNALDEVKAQVTTEGGLITHSAASRGMVEALDHFFYNGSGFAEMLGLR